jgi:TonB family protein
VEAQSDLNQLQAKLIGKPLYLRGFWMADKLEFDGGGHLLSPSQAGPLTLSGIEVSGLTVRGNELTLRANRVALVANAEGRLERRNIASTTLLFYSLRRSPGNKFIAKEEVRIVLHSDSSKSFDAGLNAIFANGLKELASSVPNYWSCYAEGYFVRDVEIVEAEKTVEDCVQHGSLSHANAKDGESQVDFTAPEIIITATPQFNQVARELGVDGVSQIHVTVSANGIPVGFQVVRAVGAGMDEEALKTVYQYQFQPATRDGHPVAADIDVNLSFQVRH